MRRPRARGRLRHAWRANVTHPVQWHLSRPASGAIGLLFDDDLGYRVELAREP